MVVWKVNEHNNSCEKNKDTSKIKLKTLTTKGQWFITCENRVADGKKVNTRGSKKG